WAPLHSSLKPANYLTIRDMRRCPPAKIRGICDFFHRTVSLEKFRFPFPQNGRDDVWSKFRTPISVIHDKRSRTAKFVPNRKGSTDCASCIARRGLNVNVLDARHPFYLAIGHRIHCTTPSQREIG